MGTCSQQTHLTLYSHSQGPSWRRHFVSLFCTINLQATSTCNDKHGGKNVLRSHGHNLQHDVPRRDICLFLLTACSLCISAAFGPTPTFSSAALQLSSSSWQARQSVHVATRQCINRRRRERLSGSYNISHYVPVVKSNGFIIFYSSNGISLKEMDAASYRLGTFSSPKLN